MNRLATLCAIACNRACNLAYAMAWVAGASAAGIVSANDMYANDADAIERGHSLYTTGQSARGNEVSALVGERDIELPGHTLPCASCHGEDGLGRAESGVHPSELNWRHLSRPSGHFHLATGRHHPPFTAESLWVTLTRGHDPAGNRLDTTMPRYRLSREDVDDLIAYLKVIEQRLDPGIEEHRLHLATVVPSAGPLAPLSHEVARLLQHMVADINARGGLYGRRLALQVADGGASADETLAVARELASSGTVFALVAVVAPGAETALAELSAETGTPIIGPLSQVSPDSATLTGPSFFLFASASQQARALLSHRISRRGGSDTPAPLVVVSDDEALVTAIERSREAEPWSAILHVETPGDDQDVRRMARFLDQTETPGSVLYLGRPETLPALAAELDTLPRPPGWLVPGHLTSRELFLLPEGLRQRIWIALPSAPIHGRTPRDEAFMRLVGQAELTPLHRQAQQAAHAAMGVTLEALRIAGRAVSRERLTEAIETLYRFETVGTPPLSYRGGRRVGASGAYIVQPLGEAGGYPSRSDWVDVGE
ncbi:ABC transporter substrate-binding protein [Halomonas urumqiensis]|uniref:Cytochrome c domain-containing protein n=1 Tax=Halomonas urumqiensis TaxID=1684789 RepID=A0A2N7UP92_9GAMM|nr:ABC transporter substrate-binding protein [Halomonas urumqiensis]PMR82249.1 hypothetical protein C1H70_03435 [Halomonas urumqiensis]PTB02973.1 hypothetical protein C6V82_00080 [Halomonas urumqiensis]GHE20910.1 ABC transporter substrate-binding protein [Halomonas urumqiensis]